MIDHPGLNHVGMPAALLLDHWGLMLYETFGEYAYLVGSAAEKRGWRDVDVRVILDEADYESWFPGSERSPGCVNARWSAITASFSLWGKAMTGLPVDFQVQLRSKVSEADWEKPRIPIGLYVTPNPPELTAPD